MDRRLIIWCLTALLAPLCAPLKAQRPDPTFLTPGRATDAQLDSPSTFWLSNYGACQNMASPPRTVDKNGNVKGEFLDWDPPTTEDSCTPAVATTSSDAIVSAQRLLHRPPKIAKREFDRGMQALRHRRNDQAVAHLAEAARLDPNFMEAEGQQGVVYARVGQPLLALDHFERALVLDPASHVLWSNKAGVLIALSRPVEAEQASRRAVQLAPRSIEGNYLLGVALLMQGKFTREAMDSLRIATAKYPRAREILANTQAHPSPGDH